MLVENLVQLIVVGNLFAINRDDDIAKLDVTIFSLDQTTKSRIGGGAAGLDVPNQHAIRDW